MPGNTVTKDPVRTVTVRTVVVSASTGTVGTNQGLNVQSAAVAASDDPGQVWLGGLVVASLTAAGLVAGRAVERKRNAGF